jgi:ribosomal protein S6E (S10)
LQDPQTPYQPITTHHLQSLLLSLFPRFKPQRKGKKRRKTHEIHSLKLS